MMTDIKIVKKNSSGKFFIQLKGTEAHLVYRSKKEGTVEYFSTFVPPEFRDEPYAEKLVTFALDYARENNLKVIATCPFVKKFVAGMKRNIRILWLKNRAALITKAAVQLFQFGFKGHLNALKSI